MPNRSDILESVRSAAREVVSAALEGLFLGHEHGRAGEAPGAEVRERCTLEGLSWRAGRVTGVRYRDGEGDAREVRCTLVVGADGRIENAYYGVKATGHVARLRKDLGV